MKCIRRLYLLTGLLLSFSAIQPVQGDNYTAERQHWKESGHSDHWHSKHERNDRHAEDDRHRDGRDDDRDHDSDSRYRVCKHAAGSELKFDIPSTGIASSVWEDGTIALTIPIENASGIPAHGVVITGIRVSDASTDVPAADVVLGDMGAKELKLVNAQVKDNDGVLNGKYRVLLRGHYSIAAHDCQFSIKGFISPRIAENGATFPGKEGEMIVLQPETADYPQPPLIEQEEEYNDESPILIPPGPFRQLFPPTPTPTAGAAAPAGSALVDIDQNNNSSSRNAGTPPDPNAARSANGVGSATGVVLATFNTGISYSLDGGATFTDVNLFSPVVGQPSRTSFFPQSDGGLCCDQIVTYVPQQNLFVWLLQYWPVSVTTTNPDGTQTTTITQSSRLRIAWATPEAIAADFFNAWRFGDLTATAVPGVSSGLGTAANEHLDYPDLAYSGRFLYVGIDHGWPDAPRSVYLGRRIVARLNLAQMADPASTVVNYNFTEYSGNGLNKTHFVQGAPDRMVLAGLDNTSSLRVYTWEDSAASAYAWTAGISSITTAYNETAPDGTDWYAVSFPGNITGATFRDGKYIFAFDGGIDAPGRPRAFVRLETVMPDRVLGIPFVFATEEYDVWNPDYAFAMAALGTQGNEIGMGLAVGGGTIGYPQFSVGYKDDFVVYTVTSSTATQGSRFGDYFSVRPIPGSQDAGFAAESYDVVTGPSAIARYTEFSRPGLPGPF